MAKKKQISIQGTTINWQVIDDTDYICITDMVKELDGDTRDYIRNWLRTGATIEFLGVWEELHNADFNVVEFHHIKSQFTSNTFLMSVKKWIEQTGAIGIKAKSGRYGGTYAHSDIAIHFANWLSPSFYVHLIKEFKRLKEEEYSQKKLEWSYQRYLTKVSYRLHTDTIKDVIIPRIQAMQRKIPDNLVYAEEADLLNIAIFGMTAREWREANPDQAKKGNIRDFADITQLNVLANIEAINAVLMERGMSKEERFAILSEAAVSQYQRLMQHQNPDKLKD